MPRLPYRGAPLQGCGRRTPFLRRILLILRGRAYEGSECLRESGNKIRSDNHLKCCLYATNPYGCPSVRAACARVPGSNEPGEAHPSFCLRTNLTLTRKTRAQFVLVQEGYGLKPISFRNKTFSAASSIVRSWAERGGRSRSNRFLIVVPNRRAHKFALFLERARL